MTKIFYLNRKTQKVEEEKVYGKFFLETLYGNSFLSFFCKKGLLLWLSESSCFSYFYGWLQNKKLSQKKIRPFIQKFHVDEEEFLKPASSYKNFNEFFSRKLKKEARPIAEGAKVAILPADGRYLVFPDLSESSHFFVKGQKLDLVTLLQDEKLADEYKDGSLVFARLCPTDYHRFHFPMDCTPSGSKILNGYLYSVNPMALRKNIKILSENKRALTVLETADFGKVLFIEVGATSVGSIKQTYLPDTACKKGDEKGYFEFGGSTILLLFKHKKIVFDDDLVLSSKQRLEVKANMGESLGRAY